MTNTLKLTARTLKVTLVLDPVALLKLPDPSTTRVLLQIMVADGARTVTADIAAKSFRKAQAVIKEHGADNVALIMQGKLGPGDVVQEAGLVAPTPAAAAVQRSGLADLRAAAAARRAP